MFAIFSLIFLFQDNPPTTSAFKTSNSKSTLATQALLEEEAEQESVMLKLRGLDMEKVLLSYYCLWLFFLEQYVAKSNYADVGAQVLNELLDFRASSQLF